MGPATFCSTRPGVGLLARREVVWLAAADAADRLRYPRRPGLCGLTRGARAHSFPWLLEPRMIWVTRYLLSRSFWAISSGRRPCSL
jgi:hypothetical protein